MCHKAKFLLAVFVFSACAQAPKERDWIQLESGMKAQVVKVGTGEPAGAGNLITIHYIGSLVSGEEIENTYKTSKPFSFTIGSGEVIKGLDIGLRGMKKGEHRKLVIPPDLAYGDRKMNRIPPNSTLVFQVELLEIQ